ncbi:uncharacterized protein LOC144440236 [Glandiceps talaboti]
MYVFAVMAKTGVNKQLLYNYIRHTGAHNKICEEQEMWTLYENRQKQTERYPKSSERDRPHRYESYHDDRTMDNHNHSNYYTKKLLEAETNDPDRWGHGGFKECTLFVCLPSSLHFFIRWGHGGFKELYPEEFESCEDSEEKYIKSKKKKKKEKKAKREKKKRKSADGKDRECDVEKRHKTSKNTDELKTRKHKKRKHKSTESDDVDNEKKKTLKRKKRKDMHKMNETSTNCKKKKEIQKVNEISNYNNDESDGNFKRKKRKLSDCHSPQTLHNGYRTEKKLKVKRKKVRQEKSTD